MKDDQTELDLLLEKLRWLRLPGMARSVESILDAAARDNWTPLQIITRLCDEERQSRINSAIKRRITDARFPEVNTVDGFDFDFDPGRKKLSVSHLTRWARRSPLVGGAGRRAGLPSLRRAAVSALPSTNARRRTALEVHRSLRVEARS
jgi:DNA replication protein DnaC